MSKSNITQQTWGYNFQQIYLKVMSKIPNSRDVYQPLQYHKELKTHTATLLLHGSHASGDFIAPNPTHSCRETFIRLLFQMNRHKSVFLLLLLASYCCAWHNILEAYKAQIHQNLIFQAQLHCRCPSQVVSLQGILQSTAPLRLPRPMPHRPSQYRQVEFSREKLRPNLPMTLGNMQTCKLDVANLRSKKKNLTEVNCGKSRQKASERQKVRVESDLKVILRLLHGWQSCRHGRKPQAPQSRGYFQSSPELIKHLGPVNSAKWHSPTVEIPSGNDVHSLRTANLP